MTIKSNITNYLLYFDITRIAFIYSNTIAKKIVVDGKMLCLSLYIHI